jgi:L,D-transpeptidase catalytic domain
LRQSWLNRLLLLACALLATACVPDAQGAVQDAPESAPREAASLPADAVVIEEPPPTKTVGDLLENGVVITVSLASQRMHVFRDGVLWRSSPVSTGKRGKETPPGVFAILQKKKFHRSNLYSNAPMPFMQRLTWSGIAIHAGTLPGYPASHGCIRLPHEFARELFAITGPTTTAVIIVDEPLANEGDALALAQRTDAVVPINPELLRPARPSPAKAPAKQAERLPATRTIAAPPVTQNVVPPATPPATLPVSKGQTIQLAATLSSELAAARWEELSAGRPDLSDMQVAVIPAVVNGTQYYRLRASAPDAHARCRALKRTGIDCFPVN